MFGHKKGAFTGAIADHEGAARRADGGTLFLEELGEMPPDLQSKLLRFIQTGTFTPVGGKELQKVDVRFICATNRNLLEAVRRRNLSPHRSGDSAVIVQRLNWYAICKV